MDFTLSGCSLPRPRAVKKKKMRFYQRLCGFLRRFLRRAVPSSRALAPGAVSAVYSVPLRAISRRAMAARRELDADELTRLADSIRRCGIIEPLLLRELSTDESEQELPDCPKYAIVCGYRRFRAAYILGLATVPCVILSKERSGHPEYALFSQEFSAAPSLFERASALSSLIEYDGFSAARLAAALSLSDDELYNTLSLLRLSPAERDIVNRKQLPLSYILPFLALSDANERAEALAFAAERELSASAAQSYVTSLAEGTKTATEPIPRRATYLLRDTRIFYNTVDRAVSFMRRAGVDITVERRDFAAYSRVTVKIPRDEREKELKAM